MEPSLPALETLVLAVLVVAISVLALGLVAQSGVLKHPRALGTRPRPDLWSSLVELPLLGCLVDSIRNIDRAPEGASFRLAYSTSLVAADPRLPPRSLPQASFSGSSSASSRARRARASPSPCPPWVASSSSSAPSTSSTSSACVPPSPPITPKHSPRLPHRRCSHRASRADALKPPVACRPASTTTRRARPSARPSARSLVRVSSSRVRRARVSLSAIGRGADVARAPRSQTAPSGRRTARSRPSSSPTRRTAASSRARRTARPSNSSTSSTT